MQNVINNKRTYLPLNPRIGKGYVMACNYYPKGNIVGEPVNKLGGPCTSCDVDRASCSGIFKGLCGLGNYLWLLENI